MTVDGAAGTSRSARRVAEKAAAELAGSPDVLAVCLVGSVARGDVAPDSDIDLVVIMERRLRSSELLARLAPPLRDPRLSFIVFSEEGFKKAARGGSLFLLHVRLEGEVLYERGGIATDALAATEAAAPAVRADVDRQLRRLDLYRDPVRLNGHHLFALSHVYSIGKAIAIARCIELDAPTFVKADALAQLAAKRPELAVAVAAVQELRPFYDLTRERSPGPLPFEPVGAEDALADAIAAVERLADG